MAVTAKADRAKDSYFIFPPLILLLFFYSSFIFPFLYFFLQCISMLLSHDGLGVLMRRNGRLIHAVDVVFVTTCVLDSSSRCLALPARIPPVVIFLHSSPFAPPVTKA